MGSGGWEVHLVLECLQTAFPSGRCPWVSDNCNPIPYSTCMHYIPACFTLPWSSFTGWILIAVGGFIQDSGLTRKVYGFK